MCSCDQSLVTLAFLWKKLPQPQFYKDLTRKTAFSGGWSWFKFNNLGLTLGTNLKFCTIVAKGLKLKVRKFRGPNPTFVGVTGEKLVGGAFLPPPPILNRVKNLRTAFCSKNNGPKLRDTLDTTNKMFHNNSLYQLSYILFTGYHYINSWFIQFWDVFSMMNVMRTWGEDISTKYIMRN